MGKKPKKEQKYRIDTEQTYVYGSNKLSGMNKVIARFMPYSGDGYKCAKCIFSLEESCDSIPCGADERKDRRDGFYRAANVSAVSVADR